MAYQEAGAEAWAGLALRESCLRRAPRRLVGAERIDEDGVHGGHIAGGERHLAPPKTAGRERGSGWDGDKRRWWWCRRRRQYGMIGEDVRDWTSGGCCFAS